MKDENYKKKLESLRNVEIKRIADRLFSKVIRLRYADENGDCVCATCGRKHGWKEMDNGHYVRRDVLTTRWDDRNCHPQCTYCNKYRNGEESLHLIYIMEKYGKEVADELLKKRADWKRTTGVFNLRFLIPEILKWKKEIKTLMKKYEEK